MWPLTDKKCRELLGDNPFKINIVIVRRVDSAGHGVRFWFSKATIIPKRIGKAMDSIGKKSPESKGSPKRAVDEANYYSIQEERAGRRDRYQLVAASILATLTLLALFNNAIPWHMKILPFGSLANGYIDSTDYFRFRSKGTSQWKTVKGKVPIHTRDLVWIPQGTKAAIYSDPQYSYLLPQEKTIQIGDRTGQTFEIIVLENNFDEANQPIRTVSSFKAFDFGEKHIDIEQLESKMIDLKRRTYERLFSDKVMQRVDRASLNKVKTVLNDMRHFGQLQDWELNLVMPVEDKLKFSKRPIEFMWTMLPLPHVGYRVEISKDSQFKKLKGYLAKENKLSVPFKEHSTYYWRVVAIDGKAEMASKAAKFELTNQAGAISQQEEIANLVAQAIHFSFVIATDVKFLNVVKKGLVKEEACDSSGLTAGQYFCRLYKSGYKSSIKAYEFNIN